MKTPPNLHVLFALCLTAVAPLATTAQTNFFTDTFADGSTLTNLLTPAIPTTNSTRYQLVSSKGWSPAPSLAGGDLKFGIAQTSAGSIEAEALFATNAVALTQVGDYIQMIVTFTNTSGLLTGSGALGFGLYNSGQVQPVPGGLNGNAVNSVTTNATGGAQNWQGYVGQISFNGANSRIMTRPAQTGPDNRNQDLVTSGSGSSSYQGSATVGSTVVSTVTLTAGATYTEVLTIALNGVNSLAVSNSLYSGPDTNGTLLTQFGGVATNTTFLTGGFDGLAIGWRDTKNSGGTTIDISSIAVVGQVTIISAPPTITSQPVSVTVPTNASCAFFVSAIGFNVTYQWHRNNTNLIDGGNISGATSRTLVISSAGTADVAPSNNVNGYYVTVSGAGGYFTNSVTNALDLTTATNLIWAGTIPTIWDLNNTAAWLDPLSNPTVFNFGDAVTFDDTGFGGNVTLTGPFLSASTVTVNAGSFTPYVFVNTSSGSFAGPGQLIYEGAGQLTIGNVNTYTGGTIITNSATKLLLQNLNGLGTGPITLAAPAAVMEISVAGATGLAIPGDVNVADDFTIQFDAVGTFSGAFNGNLSGTAGKTLTLNPSPTNTVINQRVRIIGTNTVYNAKLVLNAACVTLANYEANGNQIYNGVISGPGSLIQRGNGLTILNGANTYSGGTTPTTGNIGFGIDTVGSVTSGPIGTGPLLLAPEVPNLTGSGTVLAYGGARTISNPIQYNSATNNQTLIIGGTNDLTFTGPYTLNGNDFPNGTNNVRTLQVDNTGLTTISGVISDTTNAVSAGFGLTKTGTNTLVLSNTETYTGPTTVSAGTLRVNGALNAASAVTVTNATLSGTGTINGPVTITANGTLAPGAAAIGTLTINNNLTLAGNVKVRVNRSGSAADQASVSGTLANTGTGLITVTNTGTALQVNDTFAIFNKGVTGGGALAVTGGGVTWSNNLAAAGTIIVIATTPPRPLITSTVLVGTNLVVRGTNGTATTQFYVLSSTNVVAPLATWTSILTNTFGAGGGFSVTNPIVPGTPVRFYMLRLP